MQNGSLIECIDNSRYPDMVKLNTPYTCIGIILKGELMPNLPPGIEARAMVDGIYLQEVDGSQPVLFAGFAFRIDCPFPLADFRELMPNLAEEVEEALGLQLVENNYF